MVRQTSTSNRSYLIACHECDTLHRLAPLRPGKIAFCTRCGAELAHNPAGGLSRVLALQFTVLILWWIANLLPFLSLVVQGREQVTTLIGASWMLYQEGMAWLAIVVALTTVIGPALLNLSCLYILLGVRAKRLYPGTRKVLVWVSHLRPWAMLDVFLLGVMVSFVKLVEIADVVIGPSFYAFIALMLVSAAAMSAFEPRLLWNRMRVIRE